MPRKWPIIIKAITLEVFGVGHLSKTGLGKLPGERVALTGPPLPLPIKGKARWLPGHSLTSVLGHWRTGFSLCRLKGISVGAEGVGKLTSHKKKMRSQ